MKKNLFIILLSISFIATPAQATWFDSVKTTIATFSNRFYRACKNNPKEAGTYGALSAATALSVYKYGLKKTGLIGALLGAAYWQRERIFNGAKKVWSYCVSMFRAPKKPKEHQKDKIHFAKPEQGVQYIALDLGFDEYLHERNHKKVADQLLYEQPPVFIAPEPSAPTLAEMGLSEDESRMVEYNGSLSDGSDYLNLAQ